MTASAMRRHGVEIGLGLQSDKGAGEYARIAARAEEVGIDVLTVFGDLMFAPPIFPLLEIAGATERVRLGAACWNPYSMHPYEIAGQVAALDLASGGRAYCGIAKGSWLGDVGLAQPRPITRLRESAQYVRALLSDDRTGFSGREFQLAPGTGFRFPIQRPDVPLLLGVWGPRGLAVAGEVADEVKLGGSANPDMVRVARERLRVGEERAGRPIGSVRVCFGAVTVVDEDGEAARGLARAEVAMYIAVVGGNDPTVDVPADLLARIQAHLDDGDDRAAGELIPDHLLDRFAFAGTPEQVAAQAQSLIDVGVDRIEFGPPQGRDTMHGVELIGERVIPLLDRSVTKCTVTPSRTQAETNHDKERP